MKKSKIFIVSLALLSSLPLTVRGSPPGQIVGWGMDTGGQATGVPHLGYLTNTVVNADGPLTGAVAVSAGDAHSIALKNDGTIVGWGWNFYGQTTSPPGLSKVIAISAGWRHNLALKQDGTVVAWGCNQFGQTNVPPGLSNVVAISAGMNRSLALKGDGTVVSWGYHPATIPAGLSNVTAIAAGGGQFERNLALKRDGTVVAWGMESTYHDANPPGDLSNVVAIAVGERHSLALKSDGTVFGWGVNNYGEATGVPSMSEPYISHGLVTLSGQVLSNVVAIAAGNGYEMPGIAKYSLALKKDGTSVAWGHMGFHEAAVPIGLSNVVAIAAGQDFCLAITTNGAVAERFRH